MLRCLPLAAALASLIPLGLGHRCQEMSLNIPLPVPQRSFTLEQPKTDIDVTNFMLNLTRRGHNYGGEVVSHVSKRDEQALTTTVEDYRFVATVCHPDNGPGKFIQILTSSLGWDRDFWDTPHDYYGYSYVSRANDEHDFATLAWNGLDYPATQLDGFVLQASLEVEALHVLTSMVRNGSISEIGQYDKVFHYGHGVGSQYTLDLVSKYPDDSDGIVLTGFLKTNGTITSMPQSLYPDAFKRAAWPGWIMHNDKRGVQGLYFSPTYLDAEMLDVVDRLLKPLPMGELLTMESDGAKGDSPFKGPVFNVIGQRDVLFCEGDCTDNGRVSEEQMQTEMAQFFPNAKEFQLYMVPEGGHVLNFESHRQETFNRIFVFLAQHRD